MADNKLIYGSARAAQVSAAINFAAGTIPKLNLPGASRFTIGVTQTASLSFKVQGSFDGSTNWTDLTGTLTLSQGDVYRGECTGYQNVRLYPSAGSGMVDFALSAEGAGGSGGGSSATLLNGSELQADYDTTVAGNAVTRPYTAVSDGMKGQFHHNNSGVYSLFYKRVLVSASASTITSTNKHGVILPDQTLYIDLNPGMTVDLINSTGAATTVDINGGEY